MSPVVTPVLGGKSGWLLPADTVETLIFEVVISRVPGACRGALQCRCEHEDQIPPVTPRAPAGSGPFDSDDGRRQSDADADAGWEQVIARVAALDIGKAELVCCVRVPDEDRPQRRLQQVQTYSTIGSAWLRRVW